MTEGHDDWVINVGPDEETEGFEEVKELLETHEESFACPGCGTSIAVRVRFVSAEKMRELERTDAEWSKAVEKEIDRDLEEPGGTE